MMRKFNKSSEVLRRTGHATALVTGHLAASCCRHLCRR